MRLFSWPVNVATVYRHVQKFKYYRASAIGDYSKAPYPSIVYRSEICAKATHNVKATPPSKAILVSVLLHILEEETKLDTRPFSRAVVGKGSDYARTTNLILNKV